MPTIQIKRGTAAKVEAAALLAGEQAFATDTKKLYVSDGTTKTIINPDSAPKADALNTARDFSITGDVTAAAVAFDGSANVALTASIGDGKITKAKLAQAVQDSMDKADAAVQSVAATADKGIEIAGTATAPTIGVKIDPAANNALTVSATGLKVAQGAAPEYTMVKKGTAEAGMAATYQLQKDGVDVPNSIVNIPLDYLVKSAAVKTSTGAGDPSGLAQGEKYIDFVINAKSGTGTEDHIYLAVKDMVTPYTAGSAADDAVVIAISAANAITATLTDGKIALAKLDAAVQTSLGKADTALQAADITATTAAGTNGTITVKGTEIAVKGLGSAAYKNIGTAEGDILVLGAGGKLPADQIPDLSGEYVSAADKGAANGLAPLDANSKVPDANLPTYVGGITAADKSVTVAGTAKNPTVAVHISTTADNQLQLDANGLFVAKSSALTAGNGIDITADAVSVKVDATNAHGLSVGADGVAMGLASATDFGAVKVDGTTISATAGVAAVSVIDCGELV